MQIHITRTFATFLRYAAERTHIFSPCPMLLIAGCPWRSFTNVNAGLARRSFNVLLFEKLAQTSLARGPLSSKAYNLVNPRAFVSRASGRRGYLR